MSASKLIEYEVQEQVGNLEKHWKPLSYLIPEEQWARNSYQNYVKKYPDRRFRIIRIETVKSVIVEN